MALQVKEHQTTEACDATQVALEDQRKQMKQLVDSVFTGRKDLQRENAKFKKDKGKEEQAAREGSEEAGG